MVCANEFKEGDLLVGGTRDDQERNETRQVLSSIRLEELSAVSLIEDGVSEALARSLDPVHASEISHLSVGELKRILLGPNGSEWARRYGNGLASEAIAAVVKLMTTEELSLAAHAIFNPLPGEGVSIGSRHHFGSRIQPNSPGDDEEEILFSVLEGLRYGCGDVILGINPASDDVETIVRLEELLRTIKERFELPTRYCVLSDIVKQTSARSRARVDVGFQSLAGTSAALNGMVGLSVEELLDLARGFEGLYFETGQGSAVTNGTAQGVDMVTLESRNYGLARTLRQQTGAWMIVNDVAGFIGPEVFRNGDQLRRVCLEDTVMAKLHGVTMGLDVCSTFHMAIDPVVLHRLTRQIVEEAAPAYLMAVAGNADPMLGYLTTSFREHPQLRGRTKKQITTSMRGRLTALGLMNDAGEPAANGPAIESLYAMYMKAGGDTRPLNALEVEGAKKLGAIVERGFDLGFGHGSDYCAPPGIDARMKAIYEHAQRALRAVLDDTMLKSVCTHRLHVRTKAVDREDYLSHPPAGEIVAEEDARRIRQLYESRRPSVQVVISDGLNANGANENLPGLLPPLKHMLTQVGLHVGGVDIIIRNGRVRAGYHVGMLLDADVIVHLIGERPGAGLNTLSAYISYGRDKAGNPRWSPSLDHSNTNAVCGIHRQGKTVLTAAEEIVRLVKRMMEEHRSGVEFGLCSKPF
jgi:ethanolamine ammonia-lyase large subunit